VTSVRVAWSAAIRVCAGGGGGGGAACVVVAAVVVVVAAVVVVGAGGAAVVVSAVVVACVVVRAVVVCAVVVGAVVVVAVVVVVAAVDVVAEVDVVAPEVTVKSPFIDEACASHWKWYVPACSVTVQLVEPVPGMLVAWFTPGPLRWKLCAEDWSLTLIVYVPAVTLDEDIEMENPGPTLALSVPSVVCAPAPGLATRTAAASPSAKTTRPRATDRIGGCTRRCGYRFA
jgi:hypothetical protein